MEYKKSIGIIGHRNENISGTNLLLVPLLLVPLKIGGRGGEEGGTHNFEVKIKIV